MGMLPDVLEFLEYREYLREWFAESKRQNRFTSYRYLAQKTGLDPAWIVRVFQKEGHLNEDVVPSFIKLCNLDERRAEYFRVLHRFCKSKSPDDQKELFTRLLELRDLELRHLDSPELQYFSNASTVALRSLIGISKHTHDISALGSQLSPPISATEAQHALSVLQKLGLVESDGHGGWNITDRLVTTGAEVRSEAVRQYHRHTLELARESLSRHLPEERDISSVALTIPTEDIAEIKERIAEFRKSLLAFARNAKGADRVYQLNLAFFPLSGTVQEIAE